MPYAIRKRGNQWVLVKKSDGKVMGTHASEASAKRQMAAIHARKGKKE